MGGFVQERAASAPRQFRRSGGSRKGIGLRWNARSDNRGVNDDNHMENIFDLHSYEEVKAVYDRIGAKQVQTNYCYPRNALFGLKNKYRTEEDYVYPKDSYQ